MKIKMFCESIPKLLSHNASNYAIGHLTIVMGHMPLDCFSNVKSQNVKKNVILKVEHDFEQCAHIFWKRGQNHL
jgi:hypothetical protein